MPGRSKVSVRFMMARGQNFGRNWWRFTSTVICFGVWNGLKVHVWRQVESKDLHEPRAIGSVGEYASVTVMLFIGQEMQCSSRLGCSSIVLFQWLGLIKKLSMRPATSCIGTTGEFDGKKKDDNKTTSDLILQSPEYIALYASQYKKTERIIDQSEFTNYFRTRVPSGKF